MRRFVIAATYFFGLLVSTGEAQMLTPSWFDSEEAAVRVLYHHGFLFSDLLPQPPEWGGSWCLLQFDDRQSPFGLNDPAHGSTMVLRGRFNGDHSTVMLQYDNLWSADTIAQRFANPQGVVFQWTEPNDFWEQDANGDWHNIPVWILYEVKGRVVGGFGQCSHPMFCPTPNAPSHLFHWADGSALMSDLGVPPAELIFGHQVYPRQVSVHRWVDPLKPY